MSTYLEKTRFYFKTLRIDHVWCQIVIFKYSIQCCPYLLFKTNSKTDEQFNAKGIQDNGI